MNLEINWLKDNCQFLHYFGLGFIQLKINDKERVHFYNKILPAVTSDEEIHNHRYNFNSTILSGELIQEQFVVVDGEEYIKEKESCKSGHSFNEPGTLCNIKKIGEHKYKKDSDYYIEHDVFHKVKSKNCITYINRTGYLKDYAEVIRKIDADKVCPFSTGNLFSQTQLWEIITDMIK